MKLKGSSDLILLLATHISEIFLLWILDVYSRFILFVHKIESTFNLFQVFAFQYPVKRLSDVSGWYADRVLA